MTAAGVPSVVKAGVLCEPTGKELPQSAEVFQVKQVTAPDGSGTEYDLLIAPSKMPANSEVYFSVFPIHPGEGHAKAAQFLVPTGTAGDPPILSLCVINEAGSGIQSVTIPT